MKKFLWFVAGVMFATTITTFALNCDDIVSCYITDYDDLADWNEDAVQGLYEKDIITGYEDGSFQPNNYITRAEVAVILDRFETHMEGQIGNIVDALNDLGYIDFENDPYLYALIFAESGYSVASGNPYDDEDYHCNKNDSWNQIEYEYNDDFPMNYTVHHCGYDFWLHYEGDRYMGQEDAPYDQWFGPFNGYQAREQDMIEEDHEEEVDESTIPELSIDLI